MTISRSKAWTVLAVGALSAPTAVSAQDSTSQQPPPAGQVAEQPPAAGRTHAVRTGDTLWDLSRTYLGDPFLWPEIYRLNTDVVEDPHWIYPGEQLRIPGGSGDGVVATGAEGEGAGATGGELPRLATTTFSARSRGGASTGRLSLIGRTPAPLIRRGEYNSAPWVERDGGPRGAGRIAAGTDMTVAQQSSRDRLQVGDRILVLLPSGEVSAPGKRYLAYALGPELPGRGQVVLPTGVVTMEGGEGRNGEALHARVLTAYDNIRVGQGLIPIDSVDLPTGRPEPVELGGMNAKVLWLRGDNVLPSLHQYLVLDRSTRDGVKPGDQFTLIRGGHRNNDGVRIPTEPIATVQVIRVTPYGATAMILDQVQPAIREGNEARLTAKMP